MNNEDVQSDKPEKEVVNEPTSEVVVPDEKKNEEVAPVEEAPVETPQEEVSTEEKAPTGERCPDCPLRAGLKDENTLCPTCNGTGLI